MESEKKTQWELPFGPQPVLDFEATATWVELVPVERGATPCLRTEGGLTLPFEVTSREGVVQVRLSERPFALFDHAGQKVRLEVPRHVRAHLRVDMGRVQVSRLEGCDLDVNTMAGSVELSDCRGRFKLVAQAGQIRGERLAGTFHVEAGAGAARVGILALDPGVHHVHSNMGAVRVDLVPGLDVRIEASTALGATRQGYPSNPGSPRVLKLEADLGAVKVREGSPYVDERHGDWDDWRRHWGSGEAAPSAAPATSLREVLSQVGQGLLSVEEAERRIREQGLR